MRIQHNIPAMNAYRNYNSNTKALQSNLQKLSSGYKINKAGDDAAGLAISEKMRAQITGLEMAQKNAKDGISLVQTAEGAMTEIHTMLNRMFSLAEQSANGTYDDDVDREQLQNEFHKLTSEIDRIAKATNFNGKKLLNGDLDGPEETPEAQPITGATAIFGAKDENGKIACDNGAYLKGVTVSFTDKATDEQKEQINGDLGGNSIKISLDDTAGTNKQQIDNGDTVTFTGLPTFTDASIKLQYTDKKGDAHDVDANAITLGTANDTDLAATGNKMTLDIVSTAADGTVTKLGSMEFEFDATNLGNAPAAGAKGDTTVYFGSGDDVPAALTTANMVNPSITQPATGSNPADSALSISFTNRDTSLTTEDIAAFNDAISGKSMSIKVTHNAASTFQNNDTIAFDGTTSGDAFKALLDAQFDISYKNYNNADQTLDATNNNVKYVTNAAAGSNDNEVVAAGSFTFTISKGGKTYAEMTITPDANTGAATTASSYGISGGTSKATLDAIAAAQPQPPAPGGAITGNALRLRVGDSVETYDDIKVAIKSLKKDDLQTDLTKVKLDTKKLADLKDNTKKTTFDGDKVALSGLSVLTDGDADVAMIAIKDMINQVSTERGNLGATQNRLDHTINNLSTMQENIQDAEATIRDVDVAEEMMKYTKNNILVQSAQAMLAQANQLPQGVLQLLG